MAVYYRTQGFIFKNKDISEADRVFSIFTYDFGRLEVFGKAIRKITSKLRGGIEIFSFSEIEFIQGKNRKTLTDTISIKKFNNIIQEPARLEICHKIGDILDNFIKGQQKEELISALLNETLNKLNDQNYLSRLTYYYFFWNFLSIMGYCPEIYKCAICGSKLNPDILYFSDNAGGIVCKNCFKVGLELEKINSDIVKILRLILKKDWQTLSRLKVGIVSQELLEKVSNNYYHYILPCPSSGV